MNQQISQHPLPKKLVTTQATIGRLAFYFNRFLFWFSAFTQFLLNDSFM